MKNSLLEMTICPDDIMKMPIHQNRLVIMTDQLENQVEAKNLTFMIVNLLCVSVIVILTDLCSCTSISC